MATIIQPPEIKSHVTVSQPSNGSGGWRGVPPGAESLRSVEDSSPASRTGIWVALAAITMTFAAFTSAMIVRQGASTDWQHFTLPGLLYGNTAILLASSVVLEFARKRVAAYVSGRALRRTVPLMWLWGTFALGIAFVIGQYLAWLQLRAQGLYLATNPSSSFFYLFTALHGLHILGGLAGLMLVIWRLSKSVPTLRLSTLSIPPMLMSIAFTVIAYRRRNSFRSPETG